MKYLKYIKYVFRHKWYVMLACFRYKLYWQGLMHDISKFRPSEFFPYANFFYGHNAKENTVTAGYYKPTSTGDLAFDFAWLLHLKRNPHHWQWWLLPEDEGGLKILRMKNEYLLEMLADWNGAGKAQGRQLSDLGWYLEHRSKMQLNQQTKLNLEALLTHESMKGIK